jgi:hypothetical protein
MRRDKFALNRRLPEADGLFVQENKLGNQKAPNFQVKKGETCPELDCLSLHQEGNLSDT